MPGTARFDIYRYQILPIEQAVQLQFGDEVLDIEQLKARKNELFHDAVISIWVYSKWVDHVIASRCGEAIPRCPRRDCFAAAARNDRAINQF